MAKARAKGQQLNQHARRGQVDQGGWRIGGSDYGHKKLSGTVLTSRSASLKNDCGGGRHKKLSGTVFNVAQRGPEE
jgi:hypothetical protein